MKPVVYCFKNWNLAWNWCQYSVILPYHSKKMALQIQIKQ